MPAKSTSVQKRAAIIPKFVRNGAINYNSLLILDGIGGRLGYTPASSYSGVVAAIEKAALQSANLGIPQ